MPIEIVTAYKDSYGGVHDTLIAAQVEELLGIYFQGKPPTDDELESYGANEITRWAAGVIVKNMESVIKAMYGPDARIIDQDQIDEFQQIMAETQPSHESRMVKALAALGFDYGDAPENMPDNYSNLRAADALRSFYLVHFKGYSCTTPENELNPDDVGNDAYAYGYVAGVESVVDEIKRAIETELEGLGSKL